MKASDLFFQALENEGVEFILGIRRAAEAHMLEGADDRRFPIYPQRLVADVRQLMDSRGIIALDNGIYKIWFARNYHYSALLIDS